MPIYWADDGGVPDAYDMVHATWVGTQALVRRKYAAGVAADATTDSSTRQRLAVEEERRWRQYMRQVIRLSKLNEPTAGWGSRANLEGVRC